MARQSRRRTYDNDKRQNNRRNKNSGFGKFQDSSEVIEFPGHHAPKVDNTAFIPKNPRQRAMRASIMSNDLTVVVGCFGTGKTYVAVVTACDLFLEGRIERMIFSRPAIGAEEELGFFKGDLHEKFDPWIDPIKEILNMRLGRSRVEYLLKHDLIKFQPLSTMRGHSWPRTFMMLDEAQNTTVNQMKLFLSRTGDDSIVVVDGDFEDQQDIKGLSGLEDLWKNRFRGEPTVGRIEFGVEDIVRSGFVKLVAKTYRNIKGPS